MSENNPVLSICCITYNHEPFIRQAIEGFLMQKTDFQIEILIHDDASTDGTAEIVREYEKKYPELIFPIYQADNQYSKGINIGGINRSRARGKYIALCEGDDYWTDPLKLQKQVDFLEKNEKYVLCFHKAIVRNERINPVSEQIQSLDFKNINIDLKFILTIWHIPTASIVFRRIEELPSPEWLKNVWSRDIALVALLYKYGKIGYYDAVMSVYRLHPGGVTVNHRGRGMIKQRMILYRNLDAYFDYKYREDIRYAKKYIRHKYSIKAKITGQLQNRMRSFRYLIINKLKKIDLLMWIYKTLKKDKK
jgi:glycosyltransferase involved in cell wall biosynthesis